MSLRGAHHQRIDEKPFAHTIEQASNGKSVHRTRSRRCDRYRATDAVPIRAGREYWIFCYRIVSDNPSRRSQSQFITNEILNTARALPPMERWASSEITRSKSVGENKRWYLSLNSSDCTVVTTISALRHSSRRSWRYYRGVIILQIGDKCLVSLVFPAPACPPETTRAARYRSAEKV